MNVPPLTPQVPQPQGATLGNQTAMVGAAAMIGLAASILYDCYKGWREEKHANRLAEIEAHLLLKKVHPQIMASVDRLVDARLHAVDPDLVKTMAAAVDEKSQKAARATGAMLKDVIPDAYAAGYSKAVEKLRAKGVLTPEAEAILASEATS